ncbi:sugar phosphate isomerase/epimerase family protein [Frondihabitans australicus]|uniref:Sugar phosphate isomerase/epimerase n=1 Tax=Frondihabitans australicus TaxID=386892 RepID=A0A495IHD1_9MICO|nr:sugar phosphate isomerase/epimerase family protein [Frondihabitans australicus]RKR75169.1 sugar phosphate isomerase/epimerase [Frondihabitans australicus]
MSLVGLSTYAYFWRFSDQVEAPMSLEDMLRDTARLGAELFQICDYAPLALMSDDELAATRDLAESLGLTLEIGTRGTEPGHLLRFLEIAVALGATLVRSMWTSGDDRPTLDENVARLRRVMPGYERAGVTLALETYEQVSSADLVSLVEAIGSSCLGICLDPANTVARLELPAEVTARVLPHVVNWHVKDFDFTRKDGWVGFSLVGVPLGEGKLDYAGMLADLPATGKDGRAINRVIEHWLPWQGDPETTTRIEAEWTQHNLDYLKENTK